MPVGVIFTELLKATSKKNGLTRLIQVWFKRPDCSQVAEFSKKLKLPYKAYIFKSIGSNI